MKQRFARLVGGKKRKRGPAATAAVFCITILAGTCVACVANPTSETLAAVSSSQSVSSTHESADSESEPASSALGTVSSQSSSASNSVKTGQKAQSNPAKGKDDTVNTSGDQSIALKTKEYLLNGQNDKPEANKLKWSESFLNRVNIDAVYQKYIADGGRKGDIESFSEYLTQNAPVLSDWKTLFEADLLKAYGEKPSKYEMLQNNQYQVYVKKNGSDVPYVVVNTRTGYFHG